MKSYSLISKMKDEILSLVDQGRIKLISWDIFDTLLIRRVDPQFILEGVGCWIDTNASKFGAQKISGLAAYRAAMRELTVQIDRQDADREVSVEEIYRRWSQQVIEGTLDQVLIFADLIRQQTELYESWVCMAYEPMREVLNALVQKGVRMVTTADTFLGEGCIVTLLVKNSLSHFFSASYISSDCSAFGNYPRLFEYLLQRERISPNEVLYIGNSKSLGLKSAVKFDIKTFVHNESSLSSHLSENNADRGVFLKHRIWGGALAASYSSANLSEFGTFAEGYGRRVVGPIYTSFIHRVLERCKEEGIEQIFFLAREGYFLKKIAEPLLNVVFEQEKKKPNLRYLLVSRISTLFGASSQFGLREILVGQMNLPASLKNLLVPLSLSSSELQDLATRYGITNVDEVLPPYFLSWPPFIALLDDQVIKDRWQELQSSISVRCERYLDEQGFFSYDRVALVDIGWGAQIQESITLSLSKRSDKPQIFGFYMGANLSAHWRKRANSWVEGILCDVLKFDWQTLPALDFCQGLELISRSPHGTVLGYQDTAPVTPILKSEENPYRIEEAKMDPLISQWQSGAVKYAKLYSQVSQILSLSSADTAPYARDMLERMVRFPTINEAKELLQMKNFSDLGSDISYVTKLDSKNKLILRRDKLRAAITSSLWKYGSLACFGGYLQQFWWALVNDARNIPKLNTANTDGIVFDSPALIKQPKGDSKLSILDSWHSEIEDQILIKQQYYIEEARTKSSILLRSFTRQLALSEVLKSYLVYLIALLYISFTKRASTYRGGIGISRYIQRFIYLHPTLEKVLYGLRLISRR